MQAYAVREQVRNGLPDLSGARDRLTTQQRCSACDTEQPGADPVEPALSFAAAQVPRSPVCAQAVGQLAEQVEDGPGRNHHQQLIKKRCVRVEKLRQEGGKEQDVFRVAVLLLRPGDCVNDLCNKRAQIPAWMKNK